MAVYEIIIFVFISNAIFLLILSRLFILIKKRELFVVYVVYSLKKTPFQYWMMMAILVFGALVTGPVAIVSVALLVTGTWKEPMQDHNQSAFRDKNPPVILVVPSGR